MKKLALFLGLLLATLAINTGTSQAYSMDAPHNEASGIACWHCHKFIANMSRGVMPPSTADTAPENLLCLNCHGDSPVLAVLAVPGPIKAMHSDLQINGTENWTTLCSDCHNAHYQEQLDWNTDSGLWVANGDLITSIDFNVGSQSSANPLGTTTITHTGFAGKYADETTWYAKGAAGAYSVDTPAMALRATDGSRGLMFVANRANPNEVFEVLSATPTTITVKGVVNATLYSGKNFGLFYGQLIRSFMTSAMSHGNGNRNVKFYEPASIPATTGGFVDNAPDNAASPEGLCQSCHVATNYWVANGTDPVPGHHVGEACTDCHNIFAGGGGAPAHAGVPAIITAGALTCAKCHSSYVTDPQTAHADCTICHTSSTPDLNPTVLVRIAVDPDGAGPLQGYSWTNTGSNHSADWAISCLHCHAGKDSGHPVLTGVHDLALTTFPLCVSACHDTVANADTIVSAVNVHNDNCDLCHITVTPPPVELKPGAMPGQNAVATCQECHTTYFDNHIHPHTGINDTALCVNCHTSGVTVHNNNCWNCHSTVDGSRVNGAANAASYGGTITNVGDATVNGGAGGTCIQCHVSYFAAHTHDHVASVVTTSLCANCHAGDVIDASYVGSGNAGTHDADCTNCHSTTTGERINGIAGSAPGDVGDASGDYGSGLGKGGNCEECHGAYFAGHTHPGHATSVTGNIGLTPNTINCTGCHEATTAPYTAGTEVHSALKCETCHNPATGAVIPSGRGECVNCHAVFNVIHVSPMATNDRATTHDVLYDSVGDTSQTAVKGCWNGGVGCHSTYDLNTFAGVLSEHGSCAVCHDYVKGSGTYNVMETATVSAAISSTGTVNCRTCHLPKVPNTPHGIIDHTTYDGGAGAGVVKGSAECTSCHDQAGTADNDTYIDTIHGVCGKCHKAPTGGDALWNYSVGGDAPLGGTISEQVNYEGINSGHGGTCVDCHASHNTDFAGAGHNNTNHQTQAAADVITANAAGNCTTNCHDGSSAANIVANTHNVNGCENCHLDTVVTGGTDGRFVDGTGATSRAAAISVGNATLHVINIPSDCNTCHGAYSDFKAAHQVQTHTKVVSTNSAKCTTCHGTTNIITGIHGSKCNICHTNDVTNGTLKGSATNHVFGVASDCLKCHSTLANDFNDASHTVTTDTHATMVTATTGSCEVCHIGNVQTAVHNSCNSCHTDTTGTPDDGTLRSYAATHVKGTAQNCAQCHTDRVNGHASEHNNTDYEDAITQESSATGSVIGQCNTCHAGKGSGGTNFNTNLASAHVGLTIKVADITGVTDGTLAGTAITCGTCHNSAVAAVANTIASAKTDIPANLASCADCHGPRGLPHGSHPATDFPWDAASITACGSCHNNAGTPNVADDIHGVCDMCHVDGSTGRDTAEAGAGLNGIDGDATRATDGVAGAPHSDLTTFNCLTCHSPATSGTAVNAGTIGGIHHDNKTNSPELVANCAVRCHTATSHSATIDNTAIPSTCVGCHTATADTAGTGAPVALGDNGVHDACGTCHTLAVSTDYRGTLVTAPGTKGVNVMSTGTNNCADCHTDAWESMHTTSAPAIHVGLVKTTTSVTCERCHDADGTANAARANVSPFTAALDVHNNITGQFSGDCENCHDVDGGLVTAALAPGMTVVGGECDVCHSAGWQSIHTTSGTNHSLTVANAASDCTTACHVNTAGYLTGITVGASNLLHDACDSCHNTTSGALVGTSVRAPVMPITGANSSNCATCHTTYNSDDSDHAIDHSAGVYENGQVNAPVRTEDVSITGTCNTCHDAMGFTNIYSGHMTRATTSYSGGMVCDSCHNYGGSKLVKADIDLAITNGKRTGSNAAPDCADCHGVRTLPHGGHDIAHFAWDAASIAACGTCHDNVANPDVVKDVHGNVCDTCHINGQTGRDTAKLGANGDGDAREATDKVAGAPHSDLTTFNCLTCHNVGNIVIGGIHHDTATATSNNCVTCHAANASSLSSLAKLPANHLTRVVATGTSCITSGCHIAANVAGTATAMPVSTTDGLVHNACVTCHTFDPTTLAGGLKTAPTTKGVGAMTPGVCTGCHNATPLGNIHHGNANTLSGACEHCHTDTRIANWNVSPYSTNRPGGGYTAPPTHLACEECHVMPKAAKGTGQVASSQNGRTDGWAGNNMTITAFNQGSDAKKTGATGATGAWSAAYPKTTVHTIPNTANQINNWGICIGCHDGTNTAGGVLAPVVNPAHGFPTNIKPTQSYCGSLANYNAGQYLPGRTNFNDISNINYYGDIFRPTGTNPSGNDAVGTAWNSTTWGSTRCGNRTNGSLGSKNAGYYNNNSRANGRTYKGVTMPTAVATPTTDGQLSVPLPWTGAAYNSNTNYPTPTTAVLDTIPAFAQQTPNARVQKNATIDIVAVSSANWLGTTLTVTATVTNGVCTDLTLENGAGNVGFIDTGSCTAEVLNYTYPTDGRTVNVVSSQSDSVDVMAYPITDANVPTPASAGDDGTPVRLTVGSGNLVVTNLATLFANDGGTGITITGVTQPTFGSVGIGLDNVSVNFTGNGTTGNTQFTYTITASDASTATATVFITATANNAPVIGTPPADFNIVESTTKTNIEVTSTVTDNEADQIRVTAFSDNCGGTVNTSIPTAYQAIGQPTNISWTAPAGAQSCTISYTVSDASGSFNDSIVATVTAAPSCGTATVLAGFTQVNDLGTFAVPTGSHTTPGAGDAGRRLLVVQLGMHYGTAGATTKAVTYGGQSLSMVANAGDDVTAQRAQSWIGFCDEACLDAATNSVLDYTTSSTPTEIAMAAIAYDYVNQTNPSPSGGTGVAAYNNTRATTTTVNLPISYAANDFAVIGASSNSTTDCTLDATTSPSYTMTNALTYTEVWQRTNAATGNTTDNITITVGANSRLAGSAVAIQSECNNN